MYSRRNYVRISIIVFVVLSIVVLFYGNSANKSYNQFIDSSGKTKTEKNMKYNVDEIIKSFNSTSKATLNLSISDKIENYEDISSIVNIPTNNRRAYLLMLTSDTDDETDVYYIAISSIVHRLLHHPEYKTKLGGVDVVVMVTDDVANWKIIELYNLGAVIKQVKPIVFKQLDTETNDRWANCFTKLYMFKMLEYDTIVYLDADLLIKSNIDELFTIAEKTRKETGRKDFFGAVSGGQYSIVKQEDKRMINAGVMVITPEMAVFNDLIKLAPYTDLYNIKYMEQGLLSFYYSDKDNKFGRVRTHLPTIFNAQWFKQEIDQYFPEVKVIHQKFWRKEQFKDRDNEVQQCLLEGILDWIFYTQKNPNM